MSLLRVIVALLCVVVAGCRHGSQAHSDEQKDPYYLSGKNRLQERDYLGAIQMFEKALDINPRSASAHFELGVLYDQQVNDYPAALYHYQRAVTINSNFISADLARQRIQGCKRELAKSVVHLPTTESLQKEVDALRSENNELKQRLNLWQNYYAGRGITLSNLQQAASNPVPRTTQTVFLPRKETPSVPAAAPRSNAAGPPRAAAGTKRLHTIVSGDTLASIARRYNVRLPALQSANPHVDARRLRPGQTLVIPPP
jgi:tetratricopeptide (TPR) repeat protein